MITKINGTQFPTEMPLDLSPISYPVTIGDADGWRATVSFTLDSATNALTMPLSVWLKIFGEPPKSTETTTAELADGRNATVTMTLVSLRLETTDHQLVELHRVPCAVLDGGIEPLLPFTLLALFRVTITQGKLTELVLCPRHKVELARLGD
jgi:hypothetical protein